MIGNCSSCPWLCYWFALFLEGKLNVLLLSLVGIVDDSVGPLIVWGCTEGFMDLSLLTRNAAQITTSSSSSLSVAIADQLRLPDAEFLCSGQITSLLLGVTVQQASPTRYDFPQFQLWREMEDFSTRVTTVPVDLGPANFSTSGVFEYPLEPPVQFMMGDKVGLYQPKAAYSIVQVHETTERNSQAQILHSLEQLPTTISDSNDILTGSLLLRPVIGEYEIHTSIITLYEPLISTGLACTILTNRIRFKYIFLLAGVCVGEDHREQHHWYRYSSSTRQQCSFSKHQIYMFWLHPQVDIRWKNDSWGRKSVTTATPPSDRQWDGGIPPHQQHSGGKWCLTSR